jgi:hypothetical protein
MLFKNFLTNTNEEERKEVLLLINVFKHMREYLSTMDITLNKNKSSHLISDINILIDHSNNKNQGRYITKTILNRNIPNVFNNRLLDNKHINIQNVDIILLMSTYKYFNIKKYINIKKFNLKYENIMNLFSKYVVKLKIPNISIHNIPELYNFYYLKEDYLILRYFDTATYWSIMPSNDFKLRFFKYSQDKMNKDILNSISKMKELYNVKYYLEELDNKIDNLDDTIDGKIVSNNTNSIRLTDSIYELYEKINIIELDIFNCLKQKINNMYLNNEYFKNYLIIHDKNFLKKIHYMFIFVLLHVYFCIIFCFYLYIFK